MSKKTPRPPVLPAILAASFLLFAVMFGLVWTNPPARWAAGFSMDRAQAHLAALASRPRRIGSAEHGKARGYIVAELEKLGLAPEIQETTARSHRRGVRIAHVKNIIARRPGTGSGKALLLMAHYD